MRIDPTAMTYSTAISTGKHQAPGCLNICQMHMQWINEDSGQSVHLTHWTPIIYELKSYGVEGLIMVHVSPHTQNIWLIKVSTKHQDYCAFTFTTYAIRTFCASSEGPGETGYMHRLV